MFTKANVVANLVLESDSVTQSLGNATKDLFTDKPMRLLVLDSQAIVVYDNDAANSLRSKMFINDTVRNALLGQDANRVFKNEDSSTSMEAAVPIHRNSQITGVVYLSQSLSETENFLGDITSSLITLSLIVSALIALLSALLARIFTAPLVKLTHAADEIAQGNYNQAVSVHGHD